MLGRLNGLNMVGIPRCEVKYGSREGLILVPLVS